MIDDPGSVAAQLAGFLAQLRLVFRSGLIVQRSRSVYTMVTNRHVLTPGAPYQVETADGRVYPAEVVENATFGGNDLALLQFSSNQNYPVANLGSGASLAVGDRVYVGGFPNGVDPSQAGGFVFRDGTVTLLLDRALEKGYQLGFTNRIDKGMSGGPLLNDRGEVVGINGMHAYPLWGNPYIYIDGSEPNAATREIMMRSNWAIPIETLVQLAAGLSLRHSDLSASLPTNQPTSKPTNQSTGLLPDLPAIYQEIHRPICRQWLGKGLVQEPEEILDYPLRMAF